jgi:hypothetical protein
MTTLSIITEDNEVTYTNYTGSGPLAFTFPYFQKEDLNIDVDGVTIAQSAWDDTPNPVDGGNDGGSILLNTAVTGADVRIWRDTVRLRSSQFGVGGAQPRQIDTEFNRVVTMIQDRARNADELSYTQGEVNVLLSEKLTAPQYATYAAARLGTGLATGSLARVQGRTSAGDGGEGWFRVAAGGTDRDGITLVMADGKALIRDDVQESVDADWFGIIPGAVTVADYNTMVATVAAQNTRTTEFRGGIFTFSSAPSAMQTIMRLRGQGSSITTLERNYSEGGGDTVAFLEFRNALASNSGLEDLQIRPASGTTGGTMLKIYAEADEITSWMDMRNCVITPASGNYIWGLIVDGILNDVSGSQGVRNFRTENCFIFAGSTDKCAAFYNSTNGHHSGLWCNGDILISGGGSALTNTTNFRMTGLVCLGELTLENCTEVHITGTMEDIVIAATATNVTIVGDCGNLTIAAGATGVAVVSARGTVTNNAPSTFRVIQQDPKTWQKVAASAAALSHTGNTSETTLATVSIPAGMIGPNGFLKVTTLWTYTNSANNKTPRIKYGGTTFKDPTLTTTSSWENITMIGNRNNAAVQVARGSTQNQVLIPLIASNTAGAVNSAAAQDVVLTAQLASAGETLTLEYYIIEVLYGA